MKEIQKIEITGVDNGINAKVGCKTLVYQQKDLGQFSQDLKDYFADPEKTQKKIYKRYGIEDTGTRGWVTINAGDTYVGQWQGAVYPAAE